MSANVEFSTTLDYDFFGGGIVFVSGEASGVLDYNLDSDVKVLIFAESSNNFIDFTFLGGIELPIINATADLSFDFSVSSTVEFGVQRWAFANTRIEFTQTSEGFALVKASVDYLYDFIVNTSATQFSFGTANTELDFFFNSNVLNYSLHIYDRLGKNDVELLTSEFNEIEILNENNFVEIIDSGRNDARVLSY